MSGEFSNFLAFVIRLIFQVEFSEQVDFLNCHDFQSWHEKERGQVTSADRVRESWSVRIILFMNFDWAKKGTLLSGCHDTSCPAKVSQAEHLASRTANRAEKSHLIRFSHFKCQHERCGCHPVVHHFGIVVLHYLSKSIRSLCLVSSPISLLLTARRQSGGLRHERHSSLAERLFRQGYCCFHFGWWHSNQSPWPRSELCKHFFVFKFLPLICIH